ncbi:YibE/F family protein [Cellulomonas sp. ATA003]|uniref:YibE/F family protein n=1 Tax=Cellulomonas sp. ATA003 TaxID=3073064 RepID=UPI002872FE91|nr:YibE/F family protein [Cellulomonas sp. ATA003]WNB85852.1 YibE/F family protein [Cellulomonas sp. ATA003]
MTTHTHTHGAAVTTAAPPVRRRARVIFAAILVPALLATLAGAVLLRPTAEDRPVMQTTGPGMTFHAVQVTTVRPDAAAVSEQVRATMADGTDVGVLVPQEYLPEVAPGDRVRIAYVAEAAVEGTPHLFVDFVRGPPLGWLAAVFGVLVVAVARWRGLAALIGLGLSLAVVGAFTLPALLEGRPAMPVALVSSSLIMFVVLYLAHGFTTRTSTALLGTLVGLVATAGIAAWASGAAHLTGLAGEYAMDLQSYAPQIQLRSVLLCGMVLAGLGVLNDVTITQASAVWELHATSPHASWRELFDRGMRIGRDHIASTVYTIVFAYLGASLPLVLLLSISDRSILDSLTSGDIAEEVARTLVGSIGLVLAIPVTTAIGAWVVRSASTPDPAEPAPPPVGASR